MPESIRLKIKVIPGASRPGIVGWLGDSLKVRVAAPPDKGKANAAVLKLLARELQIQESALSIASGAATRNKVIRIQGVTMSDIEKLAGGGGGRRDGHGERGR